jgi:xanthosine utilization system XapX-like protein
MGDRLEADLARWTAAGIIDARQADQIRAIEHSPSEDDHSTPRRRLLAEIVGSLGAIAAAVAAVVGLAVLWSDLTDLARVAIPAISAASLFAAGAVVPRRGDSSSARLGALLWLLGCGALGATVAVITNGLLEWDDQNVLLVTGLAVGTVALVLMLLRPEPHLQLALIAGLVGVVVGLVEQYDRATDAQIGVGLAGLGGFVILLGWARAVPSPGTSYVAGTALALLGAQFVADEGDHWPTVIGALTAAGLLAIFVVDRNRAALVAGLSAAVVTIGQAVIRSVDRNGPSGDRSTWLVAVVFAFGAGLLAASILALRRVGHPNGSKNP